jgi:predicted ATPase
MKSYAYRHRRHTRVMPQLLCPVLVGREGESVEVGAAVARAVAGRGAALMVLGEAGIGKSRLAREAIDLARAEGAAVLIGRAVPGGRATAFRALTEALLGGMREGGPPADPELDPFRAHLGRVVPQWRRGGDAFGEASDVILAEGVLRLLRAVAGQSGCLLVLEDLHWADSETLAVVEYLADNLAGEPVLCLATIRSGERSAAEGLAYSLSARRTARILELAPLADAEVVAMAAACLGRRSSPPELGRLVVEAADGVPFLVEELLAALAAQGVIAQDVAGWRGRSVTGPVVPLSFADMVRARLEAFDPTDRVVLEAAATLGRRFDWRLLAGATSLPEAVVTEALSRAVHAQLLVAEAGFVSSALVSLLGRTRSGASTNRCQPSLRHRRRRGKATVADRRRGRRPWAWVP